MSVKQKRIVEREDKMEKYLGENIPKLGFGLMRLPMDEGKIDVARTQEMVDRFLEEGFCYFDTAYGYNDGESEAVAKRSFQTGIRGINSFSRLSFLHGRERRAGKRRNSR